MVRKKKPVVYIAGPITGIERYWEPFEKAEDELEAAGFIALTPTRLPEGLTNDQYMRINLATIDSADAVLFLPGSDKSRGAMLEFHYCEYTGKPKAESIAQLKEVLA